MRKFAVLMTVLASVGAFAPVAANAAVGTSMYQPNPIIVHAPAHQNKKIAMGRSVYNQHIKAIHHDRAVG